MSFKEGDFFITDEAIAQLTKAARLRDLLETTNLVQSGELKPATEIPSPELLSKTDLGVLIGIGQGITRPYTNFAGIAFTEIPDFIFLEHEISPDLRRIIYFSSREASISDEETEPNGQVPGCLLINPVVTPISPKQQCIVEGCGSIEYGQLNMWVTRSHQIRLDTWIWGPAQGLSNQPPQFVSLNISGRLAGLLEHEDAHLNGLTAASESFRHRLVDFRLIPDTVALGLMQPQLIDEEKDFAAHVGKTNTDWLVWNPERERLEVINYKGDYIRDY